MIVNNAIEARGNWVELKVLRKNEEYDPPQSPLSKGDAEGRGVFVQKIGEPYEKIIDYPFYSEFNCL